MFHAAINLFFISMSKKYQEFTDEIDRLNEKLLALTEEKNEKVEQNAVCLISLIYQLSFLLSN